MRAYGIRLPVVLASLVAVLAILFGFQALYTQRSLAMPLQRAVKQADYVQADTVTQTAGGLRVNVRLGLVPNLREAYRQLAARASSAAGGVAVEIGLQDTRTQRLINDYYALNAIIEQGRVTGQFVEMDSQLRVKAQQIGLTRASVIVGNTHMYVELVQGKHFLYEILPLYPAAATPSGSATA